MTSQAARFDFVDTVKFCSRSVPFYSGYSTFYSEDCHFPLSAIDGTHCSSEKYSKNRSRILISCHKLEGSIAFTKLETQLLQTTWHKANALPFSRPPLLSLGDVGLPIESSTFWISSRPNLIVEISPIWIPTTRSYHRSRFWDNFDLFLIKINRFWSLFN